MRNFLKENWFRVALLAVLIVSVAGSFYWYGLRPSNIKKVCYDVAREKAIKKNGASEKTFTKDDYDTYYKLCLEQNGL